MSFFALGGIFSKVLISTKLFFSGTKQRSRVSEMKKQTNIKHTWSRDCSDFGHDVDQYEPTGFGHEILDRPANGASACPATSSAGNAVHGHRHWTHNRHWARLRWGGGSANWGSLELWRASLFDSVVAVAVAVGWVEPEPKPEAEADTVAERARNTKF